MPIIDSDAHVVETEHTWDYMDPEDEKHRPQVVDDGNGGAFWKIDGEIRGRARGPVAAQGLSDKVKRNMVTDDAKRYMEDIPRTHRPHGRVGHRRTGALPNDVHRPHVRQPRHRDCTCQELQPMARRYLGTGRRKATLDEHPASRDDGRGAQSVAVVCRARRVRHNHALH